MLTQRQRLAIEFVFYFRTETGRYPGYQHLATAMGISRGNSYALVNRLIERGYLKRISRGYEFDAEKVEPMRAIKFDGENDAQQHLGSYLIERLPASPKEKGPDLQVETLLGV